MGYGPITEEEFFLALDRLGDRDVTKLVRAGAFDGPEAVWATKWIRGERPTPKPTPVLVAEREDPPVADEASPDRLSLLRAFRAA
jgi:hypothetical protein